jgi:hypothetical protein
MDSWFRIGSRAPLTTQKTGSSGLETDSGHSQNVNFALINYHFRPKTDAQFLGFNDHCTVSGRRAN